MYLLLLLCWSTVYYRVVIYFLFWVKADDETVVKSAFFNTTFIKEKCRVIIYYILKKGAWRSNRVPIIIPDDDHPVKKSKPIYFIYMDTRMPRYSARFFTAITTCQGVHLLFPLPGSSLLLHQKKQKHRHDMGSRSWQDITSVLQSIDFVIN